MIYSISPCRFAHHHMLPLAQARGLTRLMRKMRTRILDMRDCCDSASTALAKLKGTDVDVVVGAKWDAAADALKRAIQNLQDAESKAEVQGI